MISFRRPGYYSDLKYIDYRVVKKVWERKKEETEEETMDYLMI